MDINQSIMLDNKNDAILIAELFKAVVNNSAKEAIACLKNSASLQEKNDEGMTPFMVAASYKRINIFIKMCLYARSPQVHAIQQKNQSEMDRLLWKNAILNSKQKCKAIEFVNRTMIADIIDIAPDEKKENYRKEFAEAYTENQLNFIEKLLSSKNDKGKNTQDIAKEKIPALARFFTLEWVTKELKGSMVSNNLEYLKRKK